MKWRLVAALLSLTIVVLAVQDIPLIQYLRTVETDRITTALERDSFVIAGRAEETLEASSPAGLEYIQNAIAKGYTFIIASSDLFVLNSWAEHAEKLVKKYSND